ncbi:MULTISPECIES: SPOR domain-containing protein [unclassified Nitratiruptor]|uniref:SPOR domain-containing protein n=1 Tax=unclassified Nitratiruptor TaxID=2624044 RepID=UPI001915DDCE|nr:MULTISPECIES: SPOR domain-containing protein [unclassified Nitratiruptor]BCD60636.1 hypothetical protein NitYY0810_C1411 [Nitratiruptor sp. YY08-10]BCD64567.1 hypothetical protein NitYY0814_C1418 [Nitratiruptor sp. YY08-14]
MRFIIIICLLLLESWGGWCIVHSTQKKIHGNEDKVFFEHFPLGVIYKNKKWYRFVSGPYENLQEAKKFLHQTRHYYPTAYLRRCKEIEGNDVKKIIFLNR